MGPFFMGSLSDADNDDVNQGKNNSDLKRSRKTVTCNRSNSTVQTVSELIWFERPLFPKAVIQITEI